MTADLFTDELGSLSNDELYAAVVELARVQPNEGWRLEYTDQWEESSLKDVAAFANTFGGLLIVGVRKGNEDVVAEPWGVESDFEYKTRIASSIAANVSPVPSYSVFEYQKPGAPGRRFCVVRVKEGKALHLITKKDMPPVCVRNEDEARPANADQLRRLIEREKEISASSVNFSARAYELQTSKKVMFGYRDKESENWYLSGAQYSEAYVKLEMIPAETMHIELERSHEEKVRNLVLSLLTRVRDTVYEGVARQAEVRAARSYEYLWYHRNLDYESRWRILGGGEFGQATQMKWQDPGAQHAYWSVVDLARYIMLFAELCMRWWESIEYFGEGHFHAQLNVPGLALLRHPDGYYVGGFDPLWRPVPSGIGLDIRRDAILASPSPSMTADAEVVVNFFTGRNQLPRLTTSLVNQLLRPLGYAVVWDLLQGNIEQWLEPGGRLDQALRGSGR